MTVFLAAGFRAQGCSCIMSPVCGRVGVHDAMFVGKVLGVTRVERSENGGSFASRRFRFLVIESFNGSQRAGEEVTVMTGMGGGDCGYGFAIGERYLVDASMYQGNLHAGICGSTMPERRATVYLRELRTVASGGHVPDLSGRLATAPSDAYAVSGSSKPLLDVGVVATSVSDGQRYRAVTDGDGIYSFLTLPPAKYSISAELPHGLDLGPEFARERLTIEVPNAGGTGAACKVEVDAYPTGSISGRVVDADGHGVRGSVYVYPNPPEGGWRDNGFAAGGQLEADGSFEVKGLRDGSYLVMYETEISFPMKRPLRKVFYPGVEAREQGAVVEIKDGGAAEPVRFVLARGF